MERRTEPDSPRVLIAARKQYIRSLATQIVVAGIQGHRITQSDDGEEAFEIVAARNADILVVDCQLRPHGLGLAAMCRDEVKGWYPRIPAIAVCFDKTVDLGCRVAAGRAKCLAFLYRPIIFRDLPDAIRAAVEHIADGLTQRVWPL